MNAGADECQQGVDRRGADAGVTARQYVCAEQRHRAHDGLAERGADAGRVAPEQVHLELVERLRVDADVREGSESGVDAVDGFSARGLPIDDGA